MSPVHSRLWVRIMREHDRSAGNRSWRFRHVNSTRGLALVATVLTVVTLLTGATAQAAASVRLVPFETRRRTGRFCGPSRGQRPVGTVLQLSSYWNTIKGPGELQADNEEVRPFLEAGSRWRW